MVRATRFRAFSRIVVAFSRCSAVSTANTSAWTLARRSAAARLASATRPAAARKHGLEEQTLVFFISDNGGPTPQTTSSNLPLRGYKGQLLEGGIREPFIIQWKGHVPAGKVDDRAVIQLDVLPTALAAAGLAISPDWKLDGVNLLPFLSGEKSGLPHETLYWRFQDQRAIRRGDWKLVQTRTDPKPNLYNLAADIGEATDLADREPARLKELGDGWAAWNAQLSAPGWRRQDAQTQGAGDDRQEDDPAPAWRHASSNTTETATAS